MAVFSPRTLAVQLVTLSSATLSALYYAAQAPDTIIRAYGFEIAPWVIFFAVTAFAINSAKPLMMQVAGTPGRGFFRRATAGFTFMVLFIGSMIAVDGVLMKLRSDWAAGRGGVIDNYKMAKKALTDLEAEMASLGPSRPVGEIAAQIAAYPIEMRVWRRSNKCQDISLDETKALCQPILALYREQGVAARKVELEPKIAEARKKLEGLDPPKSADPQAEAWSKATGYDETLIAYGMVAILGLAIEIVACFGTWIAMRPSAGTKKVEANDNGPPAPAKEIHPPPFYRRPRLVKPEHKVIRALRAIDSDVCNRELSDLIGESEGETSKSWKEVQDQLDVWRDGREIRIRLKKTA